MIRFYTHILFSFSKAVKLISILILLLVISGCANDDTYSTQISPTSTKIAPTPTSQPIKNTTPTTFPSERTWSDAFGIRNCPALCWNNVLPGQITEEEVLNQFSDSILVSSSIPFGEVFFPYITIDNDLGVTDLVFQDGVVETINFRNIKSSDISVHEVIDTYGNPQWIIVHGDPELVVVELFYPQIGLHIQAVAELEDALLPSWEEANIYPEMKVLFVALHKPVNLDNFQNIISSWIWYDPYNTRAYADFVQTWHGYGTYDFNLYLEE